MARTILSIVAGVVGLSLLGGDRFVTGPNLTDRLQTGPHTQFVAAPVAPPKVLELRVQKVGPTTYFHVRLEMPADMRLPEPESRSRWWSEWDVARLPRLVPQDERTRAVYLCMTDDREGQPFGDPKAVPAAPPMGAIPAPPPRKMPADAPAQPMVGGEPPARSVPGRQTPIVPGAPKSAEGVLDPKQGPITPEPGEPKLPPPFPEPEAPKKNGPDAKPAVPPKLGALGAFQESPPEKADPVPPSPADAGAQPATKQVIVIKKVPVTVTKMVTETLPDGKVIVRPVVETFMKEVREVREVQVPDAPQATVTEKRTKTVWVDQQVMRPDGTVAVRKVKKTVEYTVQVPRGGLRSPDDGPTGKLQVETLEFVGKLQDNGPAKLLLLYPTQTGDENKQKKSLAELLQQHGSWVEVPITLDFAKAQKVKTPPSAAKRHKELAWPEHDDLEGKWAANQAKHFAMLETQADDFGFYGFARELTGYKYAVPALAPSQPIGVQEVLVNRLYEITTGAGAITELLALNRLRQIEPRGKEEERSVSIADIQGIGAANHPWEQMLAGKKPNPEPIAKLVPHDNYYLHFKNMGRFLEIGDILDQWGTSLVRALEVQSRDHQVKERLEQQLCLKGGKLARMLAPTVVKSLAVTGSDPYLREGSDVTVIFHVASKDLFLAAGDANLAEVRKAHPGKLKEEKNTHHGITIESFVTPLREVSLHRAVIDEYVVCSNSPVGIRRVIDAYRGRMKSLAEAHDFRCTRTVLRPDDPLEDGFLYLSDAFVCKLASPATRIKERRRLEGLTGLYMVTHGALFASWETGKLPNHHNALLSATGLKAEQLVSPDGDAAFWNAEYKIAFSSAYNTLNFATPLIEINIDKVTPGEQEEYEQFRQQFQGAGRQFFNPIGMRIGLGEPGGKQLRWETFILPLAQAGQYHELRRLTGDGTVKLDPGIFSEKTVAQFLMHLSPTADERKEVGKFLNGLSRDIPNLNWLGDWFTVRLDDSPVYAKLIEQMIRREIDSRLNAKHLDEDVRLVSQLPLTMGVEIRDPKVFAGVLAMVKRTAMDLLPGAIDWAPIQEPYKGIAIEKFQVRPEAALNAAFGNRRAEPLTPSLYYALVDGAWWVSCREECIHDEIDAAVRRKQGPKTGEAKIDVNASLHVNPKAGVHTAEFLKFYLEWETHRRAIANAHLLYPLYRGGIISTADNGATIQSAAMKYLGFIPVSPDYSPYSYEGKTDEIVNKRHGSLRRPQLHPGIEKGAPLDQMLEQFRSLRADVRFREEGLHSLVTFRRK